MDAHTQVIADTPARPRPWGARRRGWHATPSAAIIEEHGPLRVVAARDRLYRRNLAIADVVSSLVALYACVEILGDDLLTPVLFLAAPLIVVVAKLCRLYDADELRLAKTTLDEGPELFQLSTLYTLAFWLLSDVFLDGTLGRLQALALWLALWLALLVGRHVARTLARRLVPAERCLVVGDAASYARLQSKFDQEGINARLVGRMSLQRLSRRGGEERALDERLLRDLSWELDVHRVIVVPSQRAPEVTLDAVRNAKALGLRVSVVPHVLQVVGTSVVFDEIGGMTLLGVRSFGLPRSSRLLKRAMDLLGATIGLVAVAPFMALVAVAIKLDSPGPVFFRQTRVGRDGRRFQIVKFRTMCADAEALKAQLMDRNEAVGLFKIESDPRITRVGGLLRRTSLDELPQLFNVLRGEMSLVGPRPLVLDEDRAITGHDRRRLHLTPGMTGHWQILGSSRVPLHEMVKIDYLYAASWSLWVDVTILARTVTYVLGRRGM